MKKIILSNVIVFSLIIGLGVSNVFATLNVSTDNFVDVIVSFDRVPEESEKGIFEALGGEITHSFTIIPAIAGSLPEKAIGALERNPRVAAVELDLPMYAVNYESFDEYGNTWGVTHIKANLAHEHENEYLGQSVKVAVIDSGVDYTHRDLADRFDLNDLGFDFTSCDPKTYDPGDENCKPMDVYGHGTHVAGTVAATKDDFGVVGVTPKVQLISLRILDDGGVGSSANTIAALEWIMAYNENSDNPIRITNNSYGRGTASGAVKDAFDVSAEAGVLHIAAAGNSGNPAGRGDNVIYPAKYESVVAVSAVGENNERPSWSSTGPDVELAAPGVSVLSTWNSGQSYRDPQPIELCDGTACYLYKEGSGTSMSSPHVAGAAALVWATDFSLINTEVRNHLKQTADDLGNSNHYGYGLVNAYEAVTTPIERLPEKDDPENGNGDENGEKDPGDSEDPEESELSIDNFEVIDTSNPAWTRITIKWTVSCKNNNLYEVKSELLDGENVVDSETTSISGGEASGEHELRTRGNADRVRLTVIGADEKPFSEEKEL